MIRYILFLWAFLLAGNAIAQRDNTPPSVPANLEQYGQEVAQDLRGIAPTENSEFRAMLRIRGKKDKLTNDVPVMSRIVAGDESWEIIYETIPTDKAPSEKLVIKRFKDRPNQYFYAKAPALWKPLPDLKQLPADEAAIPFAGSDFWLTDLGLDFLHWPKQTRIKGGMRLGQDCHVLESVNPRQKEIIRIESWIDKDTGGILVAEGFNAQGEKVKQFSISGSSITKVNGQPQLERMDIRNLKTGSKTTLEFDLKKNS